MIAWFAAAALADAPSTVPALDLDRYQGTWYELASFPTFFQRGCTGTTATYTLLPRGQLEVINRCRKGSLDGREAVARGRARQPDPSRPGELEVSFFRPFWADYWVIDLDPEYRWAVVGGPGRKYLWVLSREPSMERAQFEQITARARAKGYPVDRLVMAAPLR